MSSHPKDTRLMATVACERCSGEGTIYDPMDFGWVELNKLSDTEYIDALHARGLSENGPLPPEEGDCPECEGTGRIDHELSIRELQELLSTLLSI